MAATKIQVGTIGRRRATRASGADDHREWKFGVKRADCLSRTSRGSSKGRGGTLARTRLRWAVGGGETQLATRMRHTPHAARPSGASRRYSGRSGNESKIESGRRSHSVPSLRSSLVCAGRARLAAASRSTARPTVQRQAWPVAQAPCSFTWGFSCQRSRSDERVPCRGSGSADIPSPAWRRRRARSWPGPAPCA